MYIYTSSFFLRPPKALFLYVSNICVGAPLGYLNELLRILNRSMRWTRVNLYTKGVFFSSSSFFTALFFFFFLFIAVNQQPLKFIPNEIMFRKKIKFGEIKYIYIYLVYRPWNFYKILSFLEYFQCINALKKIYFIRLLIKIIIIIILVIVYLTKYLFDLLFNKYYWTINKSLNEIIFIKFDTFKINK